MADADAGGLEAHEKHLFGPIGTWMTGHLCRGLHSIGIESKLAMCKANTLSPIPSNSGSSLTPHFRQYLHWKYPGDPWDIQFICHPLPRNWAWWFCTLIVLRRTTPESFLYTKCTSRLELCSNLQARDRPRGKILYFVRLFKILIGGSRWVRTETHYLVKEIDYISQPFQVSLCIYVVIFPF